MSRVARISVTAFALLAVFALSVATIESSETCFMAIPVSFESEGIWQILQSDSSVPVLAHTRLGLALRSSLSHGASFASHAPWTGCANVIPWANKIMDDRALLDYASEHLLNCNPQIATVNFESIVSAKGSESLRWTLASPFFFAAQETSETFTVEIVANKDSTSETATLGLPFSSASMTLSIAKAGSAPHTVLFARQLALRQCTVESQEESQKRDVLEPSPALSVPSEVQPSVNPSETQPSPVEAQPTPQITPATAPISEVTPSSSPAPSLAPSPVPSPVSVPNTPPTVAVPVTAPRAAPSTTPLSPPVSSPTASPKAAPTASPTTAGPSPTSPPQSLGSCIFEAAAMQTIFDLEPAYYGSAGQGLRVSPYKAPGVIDENILVDLTLRGVYEVSRNTPGCGDAGVAFLSNKELTNAVQSLNLSYCDCRTYRRNEEPAEGVIEDQLVVSFDCSRVDPIYQDLKINLIYKNPDKSYVLAYPATQETIGLGFNYSYSLNSLSYGVEIVNWPWASAYLDKRTYVVLDFALMVHLLNTSCVLGYEMQTPGGLLEMTTTESYVSVYADRGYLIDGIPYIPSIGTGAVPYTNYPLGHGPLDDFSAIRHQFCTEVNYNGSSWTPLVKWQNATYDPSFTAYFFGDSGPTAKALTPKQKSSKKAGAIAAGVVVGLIVVVTASLAVVILAYRNHQEREATRLTLGSQ